MQVAARSIKYAYHLHVYLFIINGNKFTLAIYKENKENFL